MVGRSKDSAIVIASFLDYFGECMEEITRRAVNVKDVDYGGVDKRKEVWRLRVWIPARSKQQRVSLTGQCKIQFKV
ncbi:MAG: hypothetical protein CVV44_11855 [Spirochaetae bacterium HGW-Spirochaetae-1]|jgi:hypothetical protein|nr:MAG: hypothetical protein CVV44_11855 [Spirochaetae bacterium HGW-Spirochaetae-1]